MPPAALPLLPEAGPRRLRPDLPPPPAAWAGLTREERQTTMERVGEGAPWRVMLPPTSLLLRTVFARPADARPRWESPAGERCFEVPAAWVRVVPSRRQRSAPVAMPALPKRIDGTTVPCETCIVWTEGAATAEVYTTEAALARRLCRLGFDGTPGQAGIGLDFRVPVAAVKLRPPSAARQAQGRRRAEARAMWAEARAPRPAG